MSSQAPIAHHEYCWFLVEGENPNVVAKPVRFALFGPLWFNPSHHNPRMMPPDGPPNDNMFENGGTNAT